MTLEEAIKHAKETAENLEYEATNKPHLFDSQAEVDECIKCAEEHRQLAEWLKDYQRFLRAIEDIRAEIENIYCGQYCENPMTADEIKETVLEIIDNHISRKRE